MGKKAGLPDAVYSHDLQFQSAEWVDNPHWDVDILHDVLRRWRALINTYGEDKIFVAEAVVNGAERLAMYLRPDELHTAFNFDYVHANWDPAELRAVVDDTLDAFDTVQAPATWAMSSHDEIRHLTRFGHEARWAPLGFEEKAPSDFALGRRRARAAIFLTLALPGGAYLYQGEELGLPEVEDLPAEVLQDPVFHRSGGTIRGRDGCRTPPVVWRRATLWIFPTRSHAVASAACGLGEPHGRRPERRPRLDAHPVPPAPGSPTQNVDLQQPGLTWIDSPDTVLHFRRGSGFECILNLGTTPVELTHAPILISTPGTSERELPADAAAWLLPG